MQAQSFGAKLGLKTGAQSLGSKLGIKGQFQREIEDSGVQDIPDTAFRSCQALLFDRGELVCKRFIPNHPPK